MKDWKRLQSEVVEPPSLEMLKKRLHKDVDNLP